MVEKVISTSSRGITFSDESLFSIGTKVKYVIDHEEKKLFISPNIESRNQITVSRKKSGTRYVPLVDIRNKEVLQLFADTENLHITITENEVVVSTVRVESTEEVIFDKRELFEAANISLDTSHLAQSIQVASFFSGAGLLDYGFSQIADYEIVFALEKNPEAARSYRMNHGNHIHVGDIRDVKASDIPHVSLFIGGPPCQGFSNSNRYTHFLDNPNNLLVREYIRLIKKHPTVEVFVLENVPELLTAGQGMFLKEIQEELSEFSISYGVLNSADFGSSQSRRRCIIIGTKGNHIDLPTPTHTEDMYRTVKDAFETIRPYATNQRDVSVPNELNKERMACIEQGENWEALPDELKGNMRKGATHSNVFRRLRWDKPSIALPNVRKSQILHPTKNRILSVREMAALFDLPSTYRFVGKLSELQQQLANGVPAKLGRAIAEKIMNFFKSTRPSKLDRLKQYIDTLTTPEDGPLWN